LLPYRCRKGVYVLADPEEKFSLELKDVMTHTLQEDLSLRSTLEDVKLLSWFIG
jgi:hypothetical protein